MSKNASRNIASPRDNAEKSTSQFPHNEPASGTRPVTKPSATRFDPTVRDLLRSLHRPDRGDAFVPDPFARHERMTADDAESLAEEFIASATGADSVDTDALDEVTIEESGGPFIEVQVEELGEQDLDALGPPVADETADKTK